VPAAAEDYVHRVGRTARAEMTGTAFTLVSPEEEGNVRLIERAISKRLPRVVVPDFDYTARQAPPLEVPHAERIAAIRQRKSQERERARTNAARRAADQRGRGHASPSSAPADASGRPPRSRSQPGRWNTRPGR
jgi:ATP-dependent RNA helicase RhlE